MSIPAWVLVAYFALLPPLTLWRIWSWKRMDADAAEEMRQQRKRAGFVAFRIGLSLVSSAALISLVLSAVGVL